ncbi:MAG: hypothetical protein IJH71_10180 [Eubacterium sp.]|nr:hypothetical protein [Eubacterium sp.]
MKLLSVAIAIAIWLLVANTNDPVNTRKFYGIKVEPINVEKLTRQDNGYAYEIIDGETVDIVVRGRRSVLSTLSKSDFQATADFEKLSIVDAIPIDVTVSHDANELEISLSGTSVMKIKKDEMVTVSVPVNVEVSGQPEEGYVVARKTAAPNLINVTGPSSLLEDAKEVALTVDVSGQKTDVSETFDTKLTSTSGAEISSSQITFDRNRIQVDVTLWPSKEVPVNLTCIGEPETGYQLASFAYEPKTVTLAAPKEILAGIDGLDLPAVDISGLSGNVEKGIELNQKLLTELFDTEDVIFADETEEIKVKATIEPERERTITFKSKDIDVRNNKRKYKVIYSSNEYKLAVRGARSVVKDLKISDFKPYINVQDLDPGEHTMTFRYREVDGADVISVPEIHIVLEE